MKHLTLIGVSLLCVALLLGMTGCGRSQEPTESTEPTTATTVPTLAQIIEQDLKLAQSRAKGEMALEDASVEYLTNLRKSLTQYYLDLGYTEQ